MSKRIEILKASLEKKQAHFDLLLQVHFNSVKETNGQPLNDKRDGYKTFKKWENQNSSLRNAQNGIEKTKNAIDFEESKLNYIDSVNESIPVDFLNLVKDGILNQWSKYPNIFFIVGVKKARIIWNMKKKIVDSKYFESIKDEKERELFCNVLHPLLKKFNPKKTN